MTYNYFKSPSVYILTSWSIFQLVFSLCNANISIPISNLWTIRIPYIYNVLSLQTPKLNWGPKRRAREMAAHTVPASPARVAMTTQVTYVNTHNRTGINEPARPHQMSHMHCTFLLYINCTASTLFCWRQNCRIVKHHLYRSIYLKTWTHLQYLSGTMDVYHG